RGTPHCFLEGVLEIEAMLDEFGTLGAHGGVLLGAITMRHVNDCAQTRAARGDRHALAVVASRRRDDAGNSRLTALQLVHVDEAAGDLEGPVGCLVPVLPPARGAGALREQRPATMGRMRSAAASIAARSGNLFVTALTGSGMRASDSRAASLAGARVTAYDGACRDQWAAGRYRFLSRQSIVFPQQGLVKIRSVSPQVSKYFLAYRRTSDPRS